MFTRGFTFSQGWSKCSHGSLNVRKWVYIFSCTVSYLLRVAEGFRAGKILQRTLNRTLKEGKIHSSTPPAKKKKKKGERLGPEGLEQILDSGNLRAGRARR